MPKLLAIYKMPPFSIPYKYAPTVRPSKYLVTMGNLFEFAKLTLTLGAGVF
jgi:hypothetical protein